MKIKKLNDAFKIQYGQTVNLPNSRGTGSTIKVTWLGLIHQDEIPGMKALYFAYKRGDILGIAYVDDEQLEIHDTEIFAEEMGIDEECIKSTAQANGNLSYNHLI